MRLPLPKQLTRQQQKLLALLAIGLLFLVIGMVAINTFTGGSGIPKQQLTIPAAGRLPPLDAAMDNNDLLDDKVRQLLDYDAAYLFVNYRQVNAHVADILFLWSGLNAEQIRQMGEAALVEYFLRHMYGLPDDVSVINNPLLGDRPWPTLFNRFKIRLLMLGHGRDIYDGRAYYDTAQDRLIIDANLSEEFVRDFATFLATQPPADRKKYANNFLYFINETKGLENLNIEDKEILKTLGKF